MIGYIVLVLCGFTFGYILPGWPAFLPLLIPIFLFIGTIANEGLDGALFVRFLLAVVVTILAVIAGRAVATARGDKPVAADER